MIFDYLKFMLIPNLVQLNMKNFVHYYLEETIRTNAKFPKLWLLTRLLALCLDIVTGMHRDLPGSAGFSPSEYVQLGFQSCELLLGISSIASTSTENQNAFEVNKVNSNSNMLLFFSIYRLQLLDYVYRGLAAITNGLVLVTSDEAVSNRSQLKRNAQRESVDCCIALVMHIIDRIGNLETVPCVISSRILDRWVHYFARALFTIPLIQTALSDNIKRDIINWKYFNNLLLAVSGFEGGDSFASVLNEMNKELLHLFSVNNISILTTGIMNWVVFPLVNKSIYHSSSLSLGHWVWGNLSMFALILDSHLCGKIEDNNVANSYQHVLTDDQLSLYLELLSRYIKKYYVDGVLQCKPGLLLSNASSTSSAYQSATAIPFYFTQQITCMHSTSFNLGLVDRILSNLNSIVTKPSDVIVPLHSSNEYSQDIAQDIKDALESTAFNIAKRQLIIEETNALQKLANKVVASTTSKFNSLLKWVGIGSSSSSSNSDALPFKDILVRPIRNLSPGGNLNRRLLESLLKFWGIVIPFAVNSSMDSSGWQLVTKLAFCKTTNTVLPNNNNVESDSIVAKLWLLLLQYDFNTMSSCSISKCFGSTRFDICVIILVMLRVMLIVMDDDEIYVAGVSFVFVILQLNN